MSANDVTWWVGLWMNFGNFFICNMLYHNQQQRQQRQQRQRQWLQWTMTAMDNSEDGRQQKRLRTDDDNSYPPYEALFLYVFFLFSFLLLPAIFFRHDALVFQRLPHFNDDGHKHDDRGQRRDETRNKKNTQEMSYDVSWASSMFFFLSFLFFFILLTLFF